MKKHFLLLLILMSMSSCWVGYNGADFSEPVIILRCEQSTIEGYSDYYGWSSYKPGFSESNQYTFRDKSGKFNVGDTIKIIK